MLICKDQNSGVPHQRVIDDRSELCRSFIDALPVGAVDDVNQAVGVGEVVAPQGPELLLASDVPDGEEDIFVLDLLDVEA